MQTGLHSRVSPPTSGLRPGAGPRVHMVHTEQVLKSARHCATREYAEVASGPRAALPLKLTVAPLGAWVLDAFVLCS